MVFLTFLQTSIDLSNRFDTDLKQIELKVQISSFGAQSPDFVSIISIGGVGGETQICLKAGESPFKPFLNRFETD